MTTRHKHADVIIAWAEGAEVEYRNLPGATWMSVGTIPGWVENYEYRVKPPAKKYRVALFKYHNTGAAASVANNEEDGELFEQSPRFVRWLTDWIEYEE